MIANASDRESSFGDNDDGQFTVYLPTMDIQDNGGGGTRNFGTDQTDQDTVPGRPDSTDDDYVILAEGYVELTAGDWTFGGSADDGFRIQVDTDGDGVFDASTDRGCCGDDFLSFNIAQDGRYKTEFLFYEDGGDGGDGGAELFAATGTHTTFAGNGFALVGGAGGPQVWQVIPEPSSGVLGLFGLLALAARRRRR